ncbi:DUF1428 domain-containing protein [Paracoccus siganidrum]|uniref:DUF1428 domain-containing protein n=1 Tax=Paracoccus siganidrum TaxID=1276757 RepID=A0A419A5L9_9RHOB|nr:DUF1428 domain-containing protein [Paracoccus siganidrum]RJL11669.1 DUF1428 domain-containing protein [Paracoccus siganidrum]RMC41192.1 DUF1428 domain-containing protein [Paracoccus siganidrum]
MAYYSGFVAAVPSANKEAYIAHAKGAWPYFKKQGARRMVECWGEDVPHGKQTDFYRATGAKDGEVPIFSWIEWPDRETCDKAWAAMMSDPDMQQMPQMPFDGMRMFWGGFAPIVEQGESRPGSYVQGFVLAAPAEKKQAYIDMARSATEMFERFGATHQIECWGEDVPRGKVTDFYRATEAKDGEVPLFSWIEWPDRATCDEAGKKMEAEMEGMEMPEMPFDGMRMFWGGFAPVMDERA